MMKNDVILFGAGSDMKKILPMLEKKGKNPVIICDNDSKKWGEKISGIPVVAPNELVNFSSDEIIITGSYFDAIYESILKKMDERIKEYQITVAPYLWLMLVNVKYDKTLLERSNAYIKTHRAEIESFYNIDDFVTDKILKYIINIRTKDEYYFAPYDECKGLQFIEGYFYSGELDSVDYMTVLDIGAYIGDTAEELFGRYGEKICRYYAFEPEKNNYEFLEKKISSMTYKNRTVLLNKALGEKNQIVRFGKSKSAFGILDEGFTDNSSEAVVLETLDSQELLVEGKLVIKMDVEGLELDILKGAKEYIEKYHPYMAICIYHRIEDICEIPKYILSIDRNYSFVLRAGVHTHLIAVPN